MKCLFCLYHQWVRLEEFCAHPDHQKMIKKPVGCKKFVDQLEKTLPGRQKNWPDPIFKEIKDEFSGKS